MVGIPTIKMLRAYWKEKTFVLVEGRSDRRLYKRFFDGENTYVHPFDGKQNVEATWKALPPELKGDVVAIVDADFDLLPGKKAIPGLFYTDAHDAESMMVRTEALEGLLIELEIDDKIEEIEREHAKPFIEVLFEAAYPIGLLLYLSNIRKLNFNFDRIDFTRCFDPETFTINVSKVLSMIKKPSTAHSMLAQLMGELETLKNKPGMRNYSVICRGHDITAILAVWINSETNTCYWSQKKIEQLLRLAYDRSDFFETKLARELLEWEKQRGTKSKLFRRAT